MDLSEYLSGIGATSSVTTSGDEMVASFAEDGYASAVEGLTDANGDLYVVCGYKVGPEGSESPVKAGVNPSGVELTYYDTGYGSEVTRYTSTSP